MTSSMAAALGGMQPEPVASADRLSWVDMESAPRMIEILDPVDGRPLGWYAAPEDPRLTDEMLNRLRAVIDEGVDNASCQASDCQNGPNYLDKAGLRPPAGIAWHLAGDADERTEWAQVTLVQSVVSGKPKVVAVCAGCSPSSLYQGLW